MATYLRYEKIIELKAKLRLAIKFHDFDKCKVIKAQLDEAVASAANNAQNSPASSGKEVKKTQ